jgi:two-component system OmpR family response regulator
LKRCLLIDSDAAARSQLATYLQGFDLSVTTAGSAAALRTHLAHQHFDLLLMDLTLPDEDGLQLCRWVQQAHPLPLIALSHAGSAISRVDGLAHGADEVIERPCAQRELVAHVRALLRRVSVTAPVQAGPTVATPSASCLQIAGWQLQLDTRTLRAPDGEVQVLDPQAFSLLRALAQRPREVLQRSALAACLPASPSVRSGMGTMRRVDETVASLRRALHDTPPPCRLILTVRGAGYVLDADVQAL